MHPSGRHTYGRVSTLEPGDRANRVEDGVKTRQDAANSILLLNEITGARLRRLTLLIEECRTGLREEGRACLIYTERGGKGSPARLVAPDPQQLQDLPRHVPGQQR